MSKAMLESITYEVYIIIDLILREVRIKETPTCSITFRNYCLTHEMKHKEGINLFEEIRCFDKNAIEEKDLVPKLSRSNMKFTIDGK